MDSSFDPKAEAKLLDGLAKQVQIDLSAGLSIKASDEAHGLAKELTAIWGDPNQLKEVGKELEQIDSARHQTWWNKEPHIKVNYAPDEGVITSIDFDGSNSWDLSNKVKIHASVSAANSLNLAMTAPFEFTIKPIEVNEPITSKPAVDKP
jgi:hypothetical protein